MRVLDLGLNEIRRDDVYNFSFPHCPQRCAETERKFPGLPLLVIDKEQRLVWGHDYLLFLQGQNAERAAMCEVDIIPVEALFLNFQLSKHLLGLNLYEKLLFVKKISRLCEPMEIQRRVELGFTLNEEFFRHLDGLLHVSLRQILAAGHVSMKTALRLMDFSAADRRAVLELFLNVRFSESHQLLAAELLAEIAFREKKPLSGILTALPLANLLAQEMPQQKIMAAIRRLRLPELSHHEDEWRLWEKKRTVPGRVALAHAPLFAKEEIQILLTVKNRREADELLEKLK